MRKQTASTLVRVAVDLSMQYTAFAAIGLYVFWRCRKMSRRLFAYIFGGFIAPGVSKRFRKKKLELFSAMTNMLSHDPELRFWGYGAIRILEIGVGSGLNLEFYPANCRLISVEPNPYFESYFADNTVTFRHVTVEKFVRGSAEDMSEIPDNSVDAVVSTLVLCSVSDIVKALEEIKRVLVPGGKFFYLEHVAYDSGTWSNYMQRLVEPLWRLTSDGCRLTCPISKMISNAGFREQKEERVIMPNEFYVVRPHIIGIVTK